MKQPDIRPIKESGDLYILNQDFEYTGNGVEITVPKGFFYDGASTPKFLWWVLPRDGVHRAAALIHDWIYARNRRGGAKNFTRKDADKLFYQMLKDYGLTSWKAFAAYKAVRFGGRFYWSDK